MDIRITKERFKEHWDYDWIKYLIIILCSLCFFLILYTSVRPELSNFELYEIVSCVYFKPDSEAIKNQEEEIFNRASVVNGELKQVKFTYYMSGDEAQNTNSYLTQIVSLDNRFRYGHFDVAVLPYFDNHITTDINGNDIYVNGHQYSAGYWMSQDMFIPVDDLIKSEMHCGILERAAAAAELFERLKSIDIYYTDTKVNFPDKAGQGTPQPADTEARNWGIDLSKFPIEKINKYIIDYGYYNRNYAVMFMKESANYAESVNYINWLLDNFLVNN